MSAIATAIVGGAIVGGGLNMIASSNASSSAADASKQASETQAASAKDALGLQQSQFDYSKKLNEPFYNMGLPAAATYAATINGAPQTYKDLNGVEHTANAMVPQETNAYKWAQSQGEKQTGRSLRAMGRYNSTYGMNAIANGNNNLAANEYDKQLARLSDLTNVARGGASSLSGLSTNFANSAGANMINSGNNQANATLAGGLAQSNALSNGMSSMFSAGNLGLKAYGAYQNGQANSGTEYTLPDNYNYSLPYGDQ